MDKPWNLYRQGFSGLQDEVSDHIFRKRRAEVYRIGEESFEILVDTDHLLIYNYVSLLHPKRMLMYVHKDLLDA